MVTSHPVQELSSVTMIVVLQEVVSSVVWYEVCVFEVI